MRTTMNQYTNQAVKANNETERTRKQRDARQNPHQPKRPDGMLDIPDSPRTGSPVPWLTTIHATNGRGRYGDARYRGNCSGLLIRDLLCYYTLRG